ncbi:MAG: amidohydrolase family protein [Actinobacteria bacterium]|nr:amidohydrolase family protein [Actinomycetota bacterium]
MLLEARWVVPIGGPPIEDGALVVTGGTIAAVGPSAELRGRYPGEPVETYADCALLPGLVNVHTHLDYSAFRHFAHPRGFGTWMLQLLLASRKLGMDDFAASALWGAHECVRNGVTSIADASEKGRTVALAARATGLRARVYLEVFGLDDAALPKTIERLDARLAQLRGEFETATTAVPGGPSSAREGPRLEWGVSPHAPYTVPPRLYREAARFARRAGLRMATHVAESQAEVELLTKGSSAIAKAYKAAHLWKRQHWAPPGISPVQCVAESGALGPDMLAVHVVHVDEKDIATLAATGTAVAHCPRSNLRLKCGIAPVADMIAAGITIGLGTDSLASNDNLDPFDEMRAALEVSRSRGAALTPAAVLRMATLEGARALGWDHLVGSLEVGKRADVVAVRMRGLETRDPVDALVAGASASDVRMTMIDGTPVFGGGNLPVEVADGFRSVRTRLGLMSE